MAHSKPAIGQTKLTKKLKLKCYKRSNSDDLVILYLYVNRRFKF